MQGIPITAPIVDFAEARQTLSTMSMAYPGEMFTIESQTGEIDTPMFVTWIPAFTLQQYLTQSISTALSNSQMPGWPLK